MKKALTVLATLMFAAGATYAGCGKKVNDEGKLAKFNEEKKAIVLKVGEETKRYKVTETTVIKDAEGKEVAAADLVGKTVKVVSEHNKVDSITGA